jgi:nicotinate dehydrogenase subunit B
VPGTSAYGSNLTPDPDTGMDVQDAGVIAASVLGATALDGGPLCPSMPAYADAGMDAAEAFAIAAYLQSLTPVWHPVPPSSCAAKLAGDGG